ncbi:MAG: vWA domain-containing protein [Phycisphaeraceae bacterium]
MNSNSSVSTTPFPSQKPFGSSRGDIQSHNSQVPEVTSALNAVSQSGICHQGLVLDVSSSMLGKCDDELSKLDALKRSAMPLLTSLFRRNQGSRVSLVTFNHEATVAADEQLTESGHGRLVEAVKAMTASGCTDMCKALETVGGLFDPNQFGIKQVTLLSDGIHEAGGDPREAAEAIRNRGIFINTIGFGDNADEDMLRALASTRNGVVGYWHAKDQKSLMGSLNAATK